MVDRKLLRRVAAILYHRRAGFSANGMGVWRVPEEQILDVGAPDGRGARGLPLLPAADLRGLALQRLHHGPRPLQGGVRRDPRRDRREHGLHGDDRAVLYSSTEFKKIRLHYFTDDYARWEAENS